MGILLLDVKTLVLVLISISFISAFTLFLFYRILRKVDGLKYAAIGGGLQALAFCLLLIRDHSEPSLAIMLTNASYLMSSLFYYQAARVLSSQKPTWLIPLVLVMVLLPLIFLFRSDQYVNERIITSAAGIGIFFIMSSYVVFKNAMRLPGRILHAITCLSGALVSVSTIMILLINTERIYAFADFHIFPLILLWFLLNNFFNTLSIIVLTSETLQLQLKRQVDVIKKSRAVAQDSLKQQQHFLSMLSHEFKAPLGAIKANTDAVLHILKKDKLPSVSNSLNRIKKVAERLAGLVDHCLTNQWLGHSIEHYDGVFEAVSLKQILAEISDEFSVEITAIDSSAMIKGEPIFLPVLFSNLVANACHYASNVSAVEVVLEEDDAFYIVKVCDDGPGISETDQKYIFDRYYRITDDSSKSGSGLGLYFVKRIIDMHGGSVNVCCDGHTTFTVALPK